MTQFAGRLFKVTGRFTSPNSSSDGGIGIKNIFIKTIKISSKIIKNKATIPERREEFVCEIYDCAFFGSHERSVAGRRSDFADKVAFVRARNP